MHILNIISVVTSFLAVLISLYTLIKQRSVIQIKWDNLEIIGKDQIYYLTKDHEVNYFGLGILVNVNVINYSPNDIAFFDLNCSLTQILPEYKKLSLPDQAMTSLSVMTKSKVSYQNVPQKFSLIGSDIVSLISLPDNNFGVFKSNSFNTFSLFVPLPRQIGNDEKTFTFSLKLAKQNLGWRRIAELLISVFCHKKIEPKFKEFYHSFKISDLQEKFTITEKRITRNQSQVKANLADHGTPFSK
ncbi:hypothetical protein [Lactiplantibacillus pentosus]|uniref:hypothetical protein n=1 Tax=Lactiplantibacillus pentosus TaxID=1589 RepID=UPI0021A2A4AC|nr:hypothetical protein [Lactiplantibacillus pentosus]MCT3286550.1 hypothetical protein [Lactiplantibacillus pentosus]